MPHVFLSYVREDSAKVDQLRKALVARGIDVWMDQQSIEVGQQWGLAISQAIKSAAFFIACFSHTSVHKPQSGMKKELTLAAEQLALRSPQSFWLIPVKLSPCDLPAEFGLGGFALQSIQHVSLFENPDAGIQRIADFILLKTEQRLEEVYRDEITKVLKSYSSVSGLHLAPMLPKQLLSEASEALGDARVPAGEEIIALAAIYFARIGWFTKILRLDTGIVFTKFGMYIFGRTIKSEKRVCGFVRYEELAPSPIRVAKSDTFDVLSKAYIYSYHYRIREVSFFFRDVTSRDGEEIDRDVLERIVLGVGVEKNSLRQRFVP